MPDVSAMCTRADHGRCPHWVGVRTFRPWRRRPAAQMPLCSCPCHAGCPLAAEPAVSREEWIERCRCPGAAVVKASFARADDRRRELNRIVGDVDFSDHPDAVEIEARLRAVFAEHGEQAPPGLTGWSRIIAAGKARRGTRAPRLLALGARAVGSTVRWSHEPASTGRDAQNRTQFRAGYRAVGVVAAVAMGLTVAAVVASGWRRWLLSATATAAWLLSGYAVSLVTAVASIARSAEASARPQDLPSR